MHAAPPWRAGGRPPALATVGPGDERRVERGGLCSGWPRCSPGAWFRIPYFCAGWNSWAEPGRPGGWRRQLYRQEGSCMAIGVGGTGNRGEAAAPRGDGRELEAWRCEFTAHCRHMFPRERLLDTVYVHGSVHTCTNSQIACVHRQAHFALNRYRRVPRSATRAGRGLSAERS